MISNVRFVEPPRDDGDDTKRNLTAEIDGVTHNLRLEADNEMTQRVKAWVAAGNKVAAYVPPVPPTPAQKTDAALQGINIVSLRAAFNHENRLRALESKQPVTLAQFTTALKALP